MAVTEVFAVRYGSVAATRADNFYRYSSYGEPDGEITLDYFFWLVTTGSEIVLVDTGFDPAVGRRRGRTCLIEPVDALGRLGVAPGDVTRIVATHLHYDHIGNLSAFPNATVAVQRRELDLWNGPMGRRFQFAQVVEPEEIAFFPRAAAEGRVEIVDGDATIELGIELRLVGGHCPGQQLVVVPGPDRPVVLASDTLHFYEEMELDRPFAIFSDLAGMYAGYDTLRELERAGAVVVAGHDPIVRERFDPVGGALGEFASRIT